MPVSGTIGIHAMKETWRLITLFEPPEYNRMSIRRNLKRGLTSSVWIPDASVSSATVMAGFSFGGDSLDKQVETLDGVEDF